MDDDAGEREGFRALLRTFLALERDVLVLSAAMFALSYGAVRNPASRERSVVSPVANPPSNSPARAAS